MICVALRAAPRSRSTWHRARPRLAREQQESELERFCEARHFGAPCAFFEKAPARCARPQCRGRTRA